MSTLKKQISEFYRRNQYVQLSENKGLNLALHASIGLAVGLVIGEWRDVAVAPLLCCVATTMWALRNQRIR